MAHGFKESMFFGSRGKGMDSASGRLDSLEFSSVALDSADSAVIIVTGELHCSRRPGQPLKELQ